MTPEIHYSDTIKQPAAHFCFPRTHAHFAQKHYQAFYLHLLY